MPSRIILVSDGVQLRSDGIGRLTYAIHRRFPKLFVRRLALKNLLMGGENWCSSATHARLTGDLLRPSTPIASSPHVQFLRTYQDMGDAVFLPATFEATSYYKSAVVAIKLYGRYFSLTNPADIVTRAKKFARTLDGEPWRADDKHETPADEPIVVRRIKFSDCYEVIDGHHRLAVAVVRGLDKYPCSIMPTEGALTPMQHLVMDSVGMLGKRKLFQPILFPELQDWTIERRCTDRLELMLAWLTANGISSGSFLDIGSSYGWFVAEMSKRGFQAVGIDRDASVATVGHLAYGMEPSANIVTSASSFLRSSNRQYDIVCCLSLLQDFVLGEQDISAADFIRLVDAATKSVLFLDTGEFHETRFKHGLPGWDSEYIQKWLRDHTSFSNVCVLGTDTDVDVARRHRYGRHLFACFRSK